MTAVGRCVAALALMPRELVRPAGFRSGAAPRRQCDGMRGFADATTGAAAHIRSGLRSRPLAFIVRSDAYVTHVLL